jgi:hypothetical protein
MNPSDLRDMLADGPRDGNWNPSPAEVQEVLAEIHAEAGDRDPRWSSDQDSQIDPNDNFPF